jgi:L-fuculose-phosphate aldolase
MSVGYGLVAIGRIRSPVTDPSAAAHQGRESGTEATVEIAGEYADGLEGIEKFDRVIVLCWLHLTERVSLKVHPRGDPATRPRGVFSTRSPLRPNPVAVYNVRLLARDGRRLKVRGMDAVDGTPVIDIRPHIPRLDD